METIEWLLRAETRDLDGGALLAALCARLRGAGVPIDRASTSIRTTHPEVWLSNIQWTLDGGPVVRARPHSLARTAMYIDSPVAHIHAGGGPIRQRLVGPRAVDFPIFDSLAAEGLTDYLIAPLILGRGVRTFVSWATRAPEGFTEAAIEALVALGPALACVIDIIGARHGLDSLLRTYLGDAAASRVSGGQVVRGAGLELPCAISFTDLRGFTAFTAHNPPDRVLETLDRYFDAVGSAVTAHGGDIVKFIGDAILAVYPADGVDGVADASRRAVAAAEQALGALYRADDAHSARLRAGFGVHVGEVFFGNVGTAARLDFTLIGAAVNLAARLESMCKPLDTPLVISDAVAAHLPDTALIALGGHRLKGIAEPVRLFTTRTARSTDDGRRP